MHQVPFISPINREITIFLQRIIKGLVGVNPLLTPCYTPDNPL